MSISAIFDKYTCTKVDVVPGYTDSSGNWIAAVETESAFNGHVSDVTINELDSIDPVIIESGVRKIAVESTLGIVPGDHIKITELDGSISEHEVVSELYSSSVFTRHLGEKRQTFLLKQK